MKINKAVLQSFKFTRFADHEKASVLEAATTIKQLVKIDFTEQINLLHRDNADKAHWQNQVTQSSKRRRCHTPLERRQGAHLPFWGHWARKWIYHWVCEAWSVRRQTYGYLPSHRQSTPFGQCQIILLGEQRQMCVNTCPGSFVNRSGRDSIYWLQVRRRSDHYATTPRHSKLISILW